MKILFGMLVMILLGVFSSDGVADAIFVNSHLGMQVGNIVDDDSDSPCPDNNKELVLDFENTDGGTPGLEERWSSMSCIGSTCLPASILHAGVNTVCPGNPNISPSSCIPSTIISSLSNVFPFDMSSESYGSGIATTLAVGLGSECIDGFGHCLVADTIIAVPEYDSYYVSAVFGTTFGSGGISICRITTALETVSTDCFKGMTAESNNNSKPIAVDPTTGRLFMSHKSFGRKVESMTLGSDGSLMVLENLSSALAFTFVNGAEFEGIQVDHSGQVFVSGWIGNTPTIKALNQETLVEEASFDSGITTSSSATYNSIWYDQTRDHIYACGDNTNSGFVSLSKLSNSGVVLATALVGDIGSCKFVRTSVVSGDVIVVGINVIHQLNATTLAIERTLTLNNRAPVGLSVDDSRHKVYVASGDSTFSEGSVFRISTCSL